jgi:UDP-N-acetylmuramoylalanine--D-glutamate ligase
MIDVSGFVMSLQNRPAAVFGLARSGLATIRALKAGDAEIIAWDDKTESHAEAQKAGAVLKKLDEKTLKECAVLILAPGVPLYFPQPHPVVEAARAAGIEIIGDIEVLHRCGHGRKTVGITGTNGKSTTTALIAHILELAGRSMTLGGNIGKAVLELKTPAEGGVFVLELSSYQIDLCPAYRPDISVLMNLTPDHIDRHGTFEKYIAAKERIFEGKGIAVIGIDDEPSKKLFERVKKRGERIIIPVSLKDKEAVVLKNNMMLKGEHNLQNALVAYKVCEAMGLKEEEILTGLRTFPGLPHRQYPVRAIKGVTYINDSKATNAEAAGKALASYEGIYWIAGGRAKEGGLAGLESLAPKIKHAFLIGEAATDFAAWMKTQKIPYIISGTLKAATHDAHTLAQKAKSGVVLLAPACASFDQFSSFEERGDRFTAIVNGLQEDVTA